MVQFFTSDKTDNIETALYECKERKNFMANCNYLLLSF